MGLSKESSMGKLILFLLLFIAGSGIFIAAGYRVHPENIPYYIKGDGGGQKQKITFRDGMTLTGVIKEETEEKLKVYSEGATVVFPRTEIESVESVKGATPWSIFMENYKRNNKIHPLITHDQAQSLGAKVDNMLMEPSRIADDIRSKHPEITSAGQQSAMMETARAVQARAREIQQKAMDEIEKAGA